MSTWQTIRDLLQTNLAKTIWFNYKMLPRQQARRLPIWIYGRFTARSTTGTIEIDGPVNPGMIRIGKRDYYVNTAVPQSIWTVRGKIRFTDRTWFIMSSYVLVSDNAILSFGRSGSYFASNTKIFCFQEISFGDFAHIAWDCQITDSSFHYLENVESGEITGPLTKPVVIGARVWVGNRSTISRGTVLPDDTIVASNSLVNRDYSDIGPFCLLAGSPATVKARHVRRIWSEKRQHELDQQYGYVRTRL